MCVSKACAVLTSAFDHVSEDRLLRLALGSRPFRYIKVTLKHDSTAVLKTAASLTEGDYIDAIN